MKKTGKRVLSWALALALLLGLAPALAIEAAAETTVNDLSALNSALQANADIKLGADITVTSALTIPDGVTIDGDNHTISVTTPYLKDSANSYAVNDNASTHGVFTLSSGSATLKNMTIMGGNSGGSGGTVSASGSAKLTMESVKITRSGRALSVGSSATAILTSCTIEHNSYTLKAAIECDGTVLLDKCTVSNNHSTADNAGGVIEMGSSSKFYANETTITNNVAQQHTGGLNNYSGTAYLMKCRVTNNTTPGTQNTNLGGGVRSGTNFYAVNSVITANKSGAGNNDSDKLDISDAPTLKNCVYGKIGNATNAEGCSVSGSADAALPTAATHFSYEFDSNGALVVHMGYTNSSNKLEGLGGLTIPETPTPADPVELDNDGYPYGSAMSSSQIKLNVAVKSEDESKAKTYQWQKSKTSTLTKPADSDFENIDGATSAAYGSFAPADGHWYRCLVNGVTYSKAVQAIKSNSGRDVFNRVWTCPYSGSPWYLSNGTMAYTVPSSLAAFDMAGSFTKSGTTYMLQTAYGGQGWKMFSSAQETPSGTNSYSASAAQLTHLYLAFSEKDPYAISIDVQLASSHKSFSFGCDTQLGNYATSGSYADYAALIATTKSSDNTLEQIAMIGAASEDAAKDAADPSAIPAFVIAPLYWLGSYSGRQAYAFNTGNPDGNRLIKTAVKADNSDVTQAITTAQNIDTGMTMSWLNLTDGRVKFGFAVGDAASTGAVSADVNYVDERIEGLEPGQAYTVTVTEGTNRGQTYTITAQPETGGTAGNGYISLAGTINGNAYDLAGQTVSIVKQGTSESGTTVTVAARLGATGLEAPGSASVGKPVDVRDSELSATSDSVTVNLDPTSTDPDELKKLSQQYRLCDENGTPVSDWMFPDEYGQVVFHGGENSTLLDSKSISAGTSYKIQARTPATASAPASTPASATIATAPSYSVSAEGGVTGLPDSATVKYSTALDTDYSAGTPTLDKGGKYTVYYMIENSGSVFYGSYEATVKPKVTFNANGGTLAEGTDSPKEVEYGGKIGTVGSPSYSGWEFAGWYADAALTERWDVENSPVTEDMILYARWVQKLRGISGNMDAITLQLSQGDVAVGKATVDTTNKTFSFSGIPDGEYDLAITVKDTQGVETVITKHVTVAGDNVNFGDIVAPEAGHYINSKLDVAPGAPNVIVGGLDVEAAARTADDEHNANFYWDSKYTPESGTSNFRVDLSLRVEREEDLAALNLTADEAKHLTEAEQTLRSAQQKIKTAAGAGPDEMTFLDLSVIKRVYMVDGDTKTTVSEEALSSTQNVLELVIPYDTKDKAVRVYRDHGGNMQELSPLQARPTSGYTDGTFYVDADNNYVAVYANQFSTYAIGSAKAVTKIGGVAYESLAAAVAAAKNGETITLLENNAEDITISRAVTFTLSPENNFKGTVRAGSGYTLRSSGGTYRITETPSYSDDGGDSYQPSAPSTPAATTVTVPVSGNEETVHVTVTVTGGSAAVRNDEALLEQVLSDEVETGTVVIDVSGLNATITEAVIPAAMVEKIAEAVTEEGNDVDGLTVKMSAGTVAFDETALAAIAGQMTGDDLRLNLDDVGASALNSAQRGAIEAMNVEAIYDAYMTSGGVRITDFKGGSATVTVNYPLRGGQKARGVVVWYVADDGSMTQMPMVRGIDEISFVVPHFSHYVLTYDPVLAERPIGPEETGVSDWLITNEHIVYLTGYEDGTIRPDNDITRAEAAMMFYRLLKDKNVAPKNDFSDVPADAWYAEAVGVLASLNVIGGYEDGTYRPGNPITRAEFAKIATRFAIASGGRSIFGDVPAEHWAAGYIATAAGYGWIGGYEDGTYRPSAYMTRATAAKIINAMLGRAADQNYVLANRGSLVPFADLQDTAKWYYFEIVESSTEHGFTMEDGVEKWNR